MHCREMKNLEKKWIEICDKKKNRISGYVCSLHFESTVFERNLKYELLNLPVPPNHLKFKKGAVPTLQLPSLKSKFLYYVTSKLSLSLFDI